MFSAHWMFFFIACALAGSLLGFMAWAMRSRLARRASGSMHRPALSSGASTAIPIVRRAALEEALVESAAQHCHEDSGITVFFIGMDGFKSINREFGYAVGDRLLRFAGERLRALPHPFDGIAHIGGDEFAAFVEGPTDLLIARCLAQEAIDAIASPYKLPGGEVKLTCSIGICSYPQYRPIRKLLAYAQIAMCAAKAQGPGSFAFYSNNGKAQSADALDIARELRSAIANQELHLVFQPKINARSGQISAAEALLRWQHPQLGSVPPSVFIPLAERFGLIDGIGAWVIDEACRHARTWRDKGLRMRIAVNLSTHQLLQSQLAPQIQATLRRHRIHPSLLTCEITESLAVENMQSGRTALHSLEQVGVHLSLDDFGTGYSSLSYLRELPVHELKIDRSFVAELGRCDKTYAIVEAMIKMSHALGKRVVAEGVEAKHQLDVLLKLRCDEVQGYFLAKPMTSDMLLLWATVPPEGCMDFSPSLYEDTQSSLLLPKAAPAGQATAVRP